MTGTTRDTAAPFEFTNFTHDLGDRDDLRAALIALAHHTVDWSDVRDFCIEHRLTIREGSYLTIQ
ncbi:hypothetical protein [Demequina phytophila]|uniref:hypothetical protein n=1 Tax=Demequina phytophila TaxID=1638981 RepID=UPI00078618A5|nr:hypothetical protein [Demequina phytophila]